MVKCFIVIVSFQWLNTFCDIPELDLSFGKCEYTGRLKGF